MSAPHGTVKAHAPDDCALDKKLATQTTELAVLHERLAGMERARDLQATEYSRRLDELNHAHARTEASNQHFVPRELHDKTIAVLTEKVDRVGSRLTTIEGRSGGLSAGWGYLVGVLGALGTIVGALAYFAK